MKVLLTLMTVLTGAVFSNETGSGIFYQKNNNDAKKLTITVDVNLDLESKQIFDVTLTKVLTWMDKPHIIILQKRKSSIYEIDPSSFKLTETLSIPSPSDADFVEVIELYGDLWIIQGSFDSQIVMVTKAVVIDMQPKVRNTLLIPLPGLLDGVLPFKIYFNSYIVAIYHNTTVESVASIYCLSCDESATLVWSFPALKNSTMDSMVINEKLYLMITNASQEILYLFDFNSESRSILDQSENEARNTLLLKKSEEIFAIQVGGSQNQNIQLVNETGIHYLSNWKSPDIGTVLKITNRIIGALNKKNVLFYLLRNDNTMEEIWKYSLSCSPSTFDSILFEEYILMRINCESPKIKLILLENPFAEIYLPLSDYLQSDLPSDANDLEKTLLSFEQTISHYRRNITMIENAMELEQLWIDSSSYRGFDDESELFTSFDYDDPTETTIDSSLSKLRKDVLELYEKLQNVRTIIPNMLSYTGSQVIKSEIIVDKLIAKEAKMFKANISMINNIPISTYKDDYMNVESDQMLTGDFHFSTLRSSSATVKTLRDGVITIKPEDFMLTNSPNQLVTGHHEYSSVIMDEGSIASPPNSVGHINGINISEVVLRDSKASFTDEKIFENTFNVDQHIKVENINKVPYEEWKNRLMPVTREAKQFFKPVVVMGNVTVDGNVKAQAINGIDFRTLYQQAAKKVTRPLRIDGPVKFENSLHVGSLHVDTVNGFNWDDVLRIKDSSVKANFHIGEAIVLGDVSGLVNDIDFTRDVMLTEGDQVVEAETTFDSDVEVFGYQGVTIENGSKINNIDPSEDAIFMRNNDTIFYQKDVFNEPIEIDGNVQIDTLNGLYTDDLKSMFWMKTSTQKIQEEIFIPKATFIKSINAHTLNQRKLNQYFLSDYQQTISGKNIFMANVSMENLEIANGRTIDGIDVSDFKNYVVNLNGQQIMNRNLDLTNVIVENLKVGNGMIGTFNLSQAVHSSNPIHSGLLVFNDPVSVDVVDGDGSLKVITINDKAVEEVFGNRQHSISVINGSLTVDRLNVSDITIMGKLNKRNITQWFQDAVFKGEKETLINNAHVKGKVFFEDHVTIRQINGKIWQEFIQEVSNVCPNCFISGRKTFTKPITFFGNLNVDYINGVRITDLVNRLLLKSTNQTITGKYTFNGDVTAYKTTTKEISGIPIDQILLVDSPGMLNGTTKFSSLVKFNRIFASHSWMAGCNLDEALSRPKFDQIYDLHANMTFGHIHIKGDLHSPGKITSRSGKDHIRILKTLVQKSKPQEITGKVVFKSRSSAKNLTTKMLNNQLVDVLLSEHGSQSFMDINCDLTFANGVKVEKLTAFDVRDEDLKFNNYSVKELRDSAVDKYSTAKITGEKYFKNHLTINGNLLAKNINGVPHNELLSVRSDLSNQWISFNEAIVYKKLSDNSDVNAPQSVISAARGAFGFPNNKSSTVNLHIKGQLKVNSVNGINLNELVIKNGEPQEISGNKTFSHLVIDGEAHIKRINSVTIKNLLSENSWPYKKRNSNIDRRLESSLLPKTKTKIENLNKEIYKLSRGLHTQLVDVSLEEFLPIAGVEKIQSFRITTHKSGVLVMARNPDFCLQCSCQYQTYVLKVRNGELIEDFNPFNGIYILLNSDDFTGQLFDFAVGCISKPMSTTFRDLTSQVGKPMIKIKVEETIDIGLVVKAKMFQVNGTAYFIVLSRVADNELQLQVLVRSAIHLTAVQKINRYIMDFDYIEIDGQHHLLLIFEENSTSVEGKTLTNSDHYMWSTLNQKFVKKYTFLDESATSVKFVTDGEESLLVYGEICQNYCNLKNIPGKIKIYRKTADDFFEPSSILSVGEITSLETFVIDKQLYMAVTLASNTLQIYVYKGEEGMRKVQEMEVQNPVDCAYMRDKGTHYLSVAINNEGILLLNLKIVGIDGSLH